MTDVEFLAYTLPSWTFDEFRSVEHVHPWQPGMRRVPNEIWFEVLRRHEGLNIRLTAHLSDDVCDVMFDAPNLRVDTSWGLDGSGRRVGPQKVFDRELIFDLEFDHSGFILLPTPLTLNTGTGSSAEYIARTLRHIGARW